MVLLLFFLGKESQGRAARQGRCPPLFRWVRLCTGSSSLLFVSKAHRGKQPGHCLTLLTLHCVFTCKQNDGMPTSISHPQQHVSFDDLQNGGGSVKPIRSHTLQGMCLCVCFVLVWVCLSESACCEMRAMCLCSAKRRMSKEVCCAATSFRHTTATNMCVLHHTAVSFDADNNSSVGEGHPLLSNHYDHCHIARAILTSQVCETNAIFGMCMTQSSECVSFMAILFVHNHSVHSTHTRTHTQPYLHTAQHTQAAFVPEVLQACPPELLVSLLQHCVHPHVGGSGLSRGFYGATSGGYTEDTYGADGMQGVCFVCVCVCVCYLYEAVEIELKLNNPCRAHPTRRVTPTFAIKHYTRTRAAHTQPPPTWGDVGMDRRLALLLALMACCGLDPDAFNR